MDEYDDSEILKMIEEWDEQFDEVYDDLLTTGYSDCLQFIENIFSKTHDLYSKENTLYYYDNEHGTVECGQEAKRKMLEDLTHNTHHYQYSFPKINHDEILLLSDSDEKVITLAKLLNYNPEFLNSLIKGDIDLPLQSILELLNTPIASFDYSLNTESLSIILKNLLTQSPHHKELYKKIVIEHLQASEGKHKSEKEVRKFINFYKKVFGVVGIEAFLSDIGLAQDESLFGPTLAIFSININKCQETYLTTNIFNLINDCIVAHHLDFPKSYYINEDKSCYFIGVENDQERSVEKVQRLLSLLSTETEYAITCNDSEFIQNMILKVNLEFSPIKDEIKKQQYKI